MAHGLLLSSSSVSASFLRYRASLQPLKAAESWQRAVRHGSLQNAGLFLCPSCWQGMPENRLERNPCTSAQECTPDPAPIQRRQLLASSLVLLAVPTVSRPAFGQETNESAGGSNIYEDEQDKYSLLVPPEWSKGEGKTGARKVTAFYPAESPSTNVNVVITPLGADYTKLGSFGTPEAFAENLVNSMDRSWTKPPGQAVKLINAKGKKDYYYLEYTIQKPGERKRHLLSAVSIGFNGWYNRLFTVTGQFWEDEADQYRTQVEKAVASFKLP